MTKERLDIGRGERFEDSSPAVQHPQPASLKTQALYTHSRRNQCLTFIGHIQATFSQREEPNNVHLSTTNSAGSQIFQLFFLRIPTARVFPGKAVTAHRHSWGGPIGAPEGLKTFPGGPIRAPEGHKASIGTRTHFPRGPIRRRHRP